MDAICVEIFPAKKMSLNEHLGMILIGTKLVKLYIQQLFLSITPSNTPAVNIIKH